MVRHWIAVTGKPMSARTRRPNRPVQGELHARLDAALRRNARGRLPPGGDCFALGAAKNTSHHLPSNTGEGDLQSMHQIALGYYATQRPSGGYPLHSFKAKDLSFPPPENTARWRPFTTGTPRTLAIAAGPESWHHGAKTSPRGCFPSQGKGKGIWPIEARPAQF